jgi:hypothetical protein
MFISRTYSVSYLTLVTAICVVILSGTANASWQLIPGKPYDGHIARRGYKEPCWSAATAKCSMERSGGKWLHHGYAPEPTQRVPR